MSERPRVIDADAHFYEPADIWDNYMEPEFYDQRPRVKEVLGRIFLEYELDGDLFKKPIFAERPAHFWDGAKENYSRAYDAWWSAESRLHDMDKYGWDLQVTLPTNGFVIRQIVERRPKLEAAVCRAYNQWAYDYCAPTNNRVKFASLLPAGDIEEQVGEARRSVEELGAVMLIIPTPPKGQMWHDPVYAPFWEAVVALDVPICLHGTGSASGHPRAYERYVEMSGFAPALREAINFPVENMMSVGHFIMTGLLDRYPDLRITVLESNSGWLPWWLSRLEKYCAGRQAVFFGGKPLELTPLEYFQRQIFVACDADELNLDVTLDYLGDDCMVFNTDYPHPDAGDPNEPMRLFMELPLSDDTKRKILWDNSLRLFGPRLLNGAKT